MLIYHLGDEQYTRWWPQFRDIVSTLRYDDDDDHNISYLFLACLTTLSEAYVI
jgi:hypothetical protein